MITPVARDTSALKAEPQPAQPVNPVAHAIREWLEELEGLPGFTAGGGRMGTKMQRSTRVGMVQGMVRDIMRCGQRFFYEATEECTTYAELQRKLQKEWMLQREGKTRKAAIKQRVEEANKKLAEWDAATVESEESRSCTSSEDGVTSSASSAASLRKVSFICPRAAVEAHSVSRWAPALEGLRGRFEEAKNGRLLVRFPKIGVVSLRPQCVTVLQ